MLRKNRLEKMVTYCVGSLDGAYLDVLLHTPRSTDDHSVYPCCIQILYKSFRKRKGIISGEYFFSEGELKNSRYYNHGDSAPPHEITKLKGVPMPDDIAKRVVELLHERDLWKQFCLAANNPKEKERDRPFIESTLRIFI